MENPVGAGASPNISSTSRAAAGHASTSCIAPAEPLPYPEQPVDYILNNQQTPIAPAYSEDPANTGEEPPPFSVYTPESHKVGNGRVISHDPHLNTDTEALFQWLSSEAATRPQQLMHLRGTHTETSRTTSANGKSTTQSRTVVDFDLTFDLSHFMLPGCSVLAVGPEAKRKRGTRAAIEGDPEEAKSIRDWCADYITSPVLLKEFIVKKYVAMLNADYMEQEVRAWVRAADYRQTVSVQFPVNNRTVLVAPESWISNVRYSGWRWAFYISMLWIFTWPVLWFWTKKWEVVDAFFYVRNGDEVLWCGRWAWVVGRMVKRRMKQSQITPANLRWLERQEKERLKVEGEMEMARLRAQRERRQAREGTFIGGILNSFS